MTVMDREEIERVEQELDAILKLVQPELPTQDNQPKLDTTHKTDIGLKAETKLKADAELRTDTGMRKDACMNTDTDLKTDIEIKTAAEFKIDNNPKMDATLKTVNCTKTDYRLKEQAVQQKQADENHEAAERESAADEDLGERKKNAFEEGDWGGWDTFQGQDGAGAYIRRQWQSDQEKRWNTADRRGRSLRLLKPSDGMIAAFFVPVIVMIIIFAQRGIFPFGEECFLRTDMYHQYAPFFSEFQYKLTHGKSLLYSWDIGMGVNFSALYAYYLASPVNWLLLLCPKKYIIEFMTLAIVLKIGLSGLSFSWYLKRHFGTRDFGVGLFGIFYALSGYMAAYSWNIMWLDCILLFPLVLLGVENLVKGKSGILYCLTLGMCILSNYYISIMICIFMVIYVIAQVIINPPGSIVKLAVTGLRFAVYSLLAGGLAAVVLLPEIYALQATASGKFDFPKTFSSYFSIFDMIARHIGNVGTEIGLDHWPNIYCGVAALMFFLLFLGSRKIAFREKAVYCSLLIIFYASFSVNVLNFIWHGFHYPNSLPCRQSFIYIALMLVMCYQAYIHLRETSWKHICLAFWGAVIFVLLAEKLVDHPEQFHFSVFYVAILFIAIYAGLIYQYKKGGWSLDAIILAALAAVSIEAAVNTAVTSVPTTSRTDYVKDNQDVEKLIAKIEDQDFYRVEKSDRKTKNDGAWMNFPSASLFSSTADASLSDFFRVLGCESSTNAYSITGSTPLVDSLFSVRYGIYPDQQPSGSSMKQVKRKGNVWLYENDYTLPVAFMLPKDVEANWITDSGNPALVQNDLCNVLGTEPVLIPNESVTDGRKLTFTAEATGDYYVYVTNKKVKEVSVVIGERSESFDNVDRGYFLELGYITQGAQVKLESKDEGNPTLQAEVWRFNPSGLKSVYEKMNANPISVTGWTDTKISGSITADQAGVVYTSIPYDKGWTVTVDQALVAPRKLFDTFLAIDVSEGTHEITMSYEPEGLRTGAWITGGSAAALGAILAAGHAIKRKRNMKYNTARR